MSHALACPVAAALVVLGGCSGRSAVETGGSVVRVTLRDFSISAAPLQLSSGEVVLSVHNRGPVEHELVVVRSDGSELPLRRDGVTIDEEALEPAIAGVLEAGEPGSVRQLRVRLAPGRYEIFCNMSGHYLGGMYAELVVA